MSARSTLREQLRRIDAELDVPGPDWQRVLERARRELVVRQAMTTVAALALFAALVAGGLLARSALAGAEEEPGKPPRTPPAVTTPTPRQAPPPTATSPPPTTSQAPTTSTPEPKRLPDLTLKRANGIVEVENSGNARAGRFRVEARSADGERRATLRELPGLDPGASEPIDFACPEPAEGRPATVVIADPDNSVAETEEENNSLTCGEQAG